MVTFRARLELSGSTSGIPVPDDVVESFNAGKRVPVIVTIGDFSYRNSVAPYRGRYMISLSSANRQAAGLIGDEEVEITLEQDTAPREVWVPDDLDTALNAAAPARSAFDALSYSAKNAHVLAVEGAKTPGTRSRRIAGIVEKLGGQPA